MPEHLKICVEGAAQQPRRSKTGEPYDDLATIMKGSESVEHYFRIGWRARKQRERAAA